MIAASRHALCTALYEWGCNLRTMRFGQLACAAGSSANEGVPADIEEVSDADLFASIKQRIDQASKAGRISKSDDGVNQIQAELADVLGELADRHSELRFGQLISRVAEKALANLYDVQDEQLLKVARCVLQRDVALEPVTYAITFPHVIQTKLKSVDKLTSGDFLCVTLPDAREVIKWYWGSESTGISRGAQFEQFVQSAANQHEPNRVTWDNVKATSLIHGRFADKLVADFVDRELDCLSKIPVQTDMFASREFDGLAVDLFSALLRPGIQPANLTKLLYQKRPKLIPILDDFVRRAANVPYLWDEPEQQDKGIRALRQRALSPDGNCEPIELLNYWLTDEPEMGALALAFRQFRYLAGFANNAKAISNLTQWIESNPRMTSNLRLSKVRLLDILGWSVIDHFERNDESMLCVKNSQKGHCN